jgi:hypothetical protein
VLWDSVNTMTIIQDLMPAGEGWIAKAAETIDDKGEIGVNGWQNGTDRSGYYGALLTPAS